MSASAGKLPMTRSIRTLTPVAPSLWRSLPMDTTAARLFSRSSTACGPIGPRSRSQGRRPTRVSRAGLDVEIAPLLLDLWRLGCWTLNSCQDNFGKVWLEFDDGGAAELFCSIAAGAFDQQLESLYTRVLGWGSTRIGRPSRTSAWRYAVVPTDLNVEWETAREEPWEEVGRSRGAPQVVFHVSVRFPRSDLPEVARRVRAAREAGGCRQRP